MHALKRLLALWQKLDLLKLLICFFSWSGTVFAASLLLADFARFDFWMMSIAAALASWFVTDALLEDFHAEDHIPTHGSRIPSQ